MIFTEIDTKPLEDQIAELTGTKKGAEAKLGDLNQELENIRVRGGSVEKLKAEISSLEREIRSKDAEIEQLKKSPLLKSQPVALPSDPEIPAPGPETAVLVESGPAPHASFYPVPSGAGSSVPAGYYGATEGFYGYAGQGDYGGSDELWADEGTIHFSPSPGSDYQPYKYTPGRRKRIYSLLELATDRELLKLCPVTRKTVLTPAKLYDQRVDISNLGIWFDNNELIATISNMKPGLFGHLSNIVRGLSNPANEITKRVSELQKIRDEYDGKYDKWAVLDRKIKQKQDLKSATPEFEQLTRELELMAAGLVEPIDITPGSAVAIKFEPKNLIGAPGHTDLKFCPEWMARGKRHPMARILILGNELDASEHGIWFDKGELVKVISSVNKKEEGLFRRAVGFFKKGGGAKDKLEGIVTETLNTIKERDEAYRNWQEAEKKGNAQEAEKWRNKYTQLSKKLRNPKDLY